MPTAPTATMQREAGVLSSQQHVKTEALRNESTLLSQRSKTSTAKPIRYSMSKVMSCHHGGAIALWCCAAPYHNLDTRRAHTL